jgi:hypothetical protein
VLGLTVPKAAVRTAEVARETFVPWYETCGDY